MATRPPTTPPMRMSDAAARALLTEWIGDDTFYMPTTPKTGHLVHTRIDVEVLVGLSDANTRKLRRVMEGLNALPCCRGFRVDENPAFWRRALPTLGPSELDIADHNLYALAPDLLSRYRLLTGFTSQTEAMAWAIVSCFSNTPASEAMVDRHQIHQRLEPYLVREPPLLDLELQHKLPWGNEAAPDRY